MTIRKVLLKLAAISCLIMVPATLLGQASDDGSPAPGGDTVVARVNGDEILLGHIIAFASQLPPRYDQVDPRSLYNSILEQLIHHSLLANYGESRLPALKFLGENLARSGKAEETISAITAGMVTEERVRAVYEDRYVLSEPQQEFKASHILVATAEEAGEILGELRAGADFAETAKARSTGPSGADGGNLGWFGEGQMVKAFEQAVKVLAVGEISGPVQSQFGWHIILLEGKRDRPIPSLEDARQEIEQFIAGKAVETVLIELTTGAEIERLDQSIDHGLVRNLEILQPN